MQFHPEARRGQVLRWFEEDEESLPAPLAEIERELEAKIDGWHRLGRALCLAFLAEAATRTRRPLKRPYCFGSSPNTSSASGRRVFARISAECRQPPVKPTSAARGLSARIALTSRPGLALLVDHDLVARAPPHLQRHPRERDRADVGDRAPQLVGVRILAR